MSLNHSLHPNPCSLTLLARLRQDKSYPRSLARAHTHQTIPLGDLSGALDRSGMEVNFCAPTDAVMSAKGNRRPLHAESMPSTRRGEIPFVWSNPECGAPQCPARISDNDHAGHCGISATLKA